MKGMLTFFAGILSVIAVGILLIAYGLLSPRVATADGAMLSRPMYASDRVPLDQGDSSYSTAGAYGSRQLAYPVNGMATMNGVRAVPAAETYQAPRTATVSRPARYDDHPARVERSPGRDWVKTAMVIGGSSAAGAGLGGIFGGKKGALIGAALGGGGATIFEMRKR
jgi:hypothetical protein